MGHPHRIGVPSLEVTLYADGQILDAISKRFLNPTGARLGEDIELFMDNVASYSTKILLAMPNRMHTDKMLCQIIALLTEMTCIHEISHVYGCNGTQARKAQWITS